MNIIMIKLKYPGDFMDTDNERTWMINKLNRYKSSMKSRENDLLEQLSKYYKKDESEINGQYKVDGGFKDLEYDIYNNPYETYLVAQIKIVRALPLILNKHITCLKEGNDVDHVIESLEYEIYKIKKVVYSNIKEWEILLNHLSDYRRLEIEKNPKGPGDLIIKELFWIKEFEEGLK